MLRQALTIARKELWDGVRDVRPLLSSFLYCLMGPGIVFIVSFSLKGKGQAESGPVLIGMMSVFVLVSAFVGGMNVAMDVLAGERERQSLLPLLMNVVKRRDVVLGKWLAISCFSTAAVVIDLAAFLLVLASAHVPAAGMKGWLLVLASGLIPLALFAAAVELGVSTICRTMKEAHTYLSMLVFIPMAVGMFLVFFPQANRNWIHAMPLMGQQWQIEHWARGGGIPLLQALVLAVITAALTGLTLWIAANLLERDDVVYGG